jgi:glycosyltransferase involved in cell wall biosynthesis
MSNGVIWLGFSIPSSDAETLRRLDTAPAVQTLKFAWSFSRVLRIAFGSVRLISTEPIQNYPLGKKILFRPGSFLEDGFSGRKVAFINLLGLKHLTRFIVSLYHLVSAQCTEKIDIVFVHGLHSPFLLSALLMKRFNVRVVFVLTDAPGISISTDTFFEKLLKSLDQLMVRSLVARADAVIALAPRLVTELAPEVPALVFPGIVSCNDATAVDEALSANTAPRDCAFSLVYAGGLSAAYGVDRLIEAVIGMPFDVNVQLRLFGRGDQEKYARQISASNPRIYFGGFLDPNSIRSELLKADLLINTRPSVGQISAMSFPSKLVEYLSTGRPVLTTKIPSIPTYLDDCFFYAHDETPAGIRKAIMEVMLLTGVERARFGKKAKQVVESRLSEEAIGRLVGSFLNV